MTQLAIASLVPVHDRYGVIDYALVDEGDYDNLMAVGRWSIRQDGYAARGFRQDDGSWVWLSMHRYLLGMKKGDGLHVDHRNHDKLDNRRENLRAVTPREHMLRRRFDGSFRREVAALSARREARRARFGQVAA